MFLLKALKSVAIKMKVFEEVNLMIAGLDERRFNGKLPNSHCISNKLKFVGQNWFDFGDVLSLNNSISAIRKNRIKREGF